MKPKGSPLVGEATVGARGRVDHAVSQTRGNKAFALVNLDPRLVCGMQVDRNHPFVFSRLDIGSCDGLHQFRTPVQAHDVEGERRDVFVVEGNGVLEPFEKAFFRGLRVHDRDEFVLYPGGYGGDTVGDFSQLVVHEDAVEELVSVDSEYRFRDPARVVSVDAFAGFGRNTVFAGGLEGGHRFQRGGQGVVAEYDVGGVLGAKRLGGVGFFRSDHHGNVALFQNPGQGQG
jgi:hypothetical protein